MSTLGAHDTKSGCIKVWNVIFQNVVKIVAKAKLHLPGFWKQAGVDSLLYFIL